MHEIYRRFSRTRTQVTIREIRKRAKALGIKPGSKSKAALVRVIQSAEGNPACFRTGRTHCDETACCWLEDCVPQQFADMRQLSGIGARTGKWRR